MRVYAFCPLPVGAVFFRAPEPRVAIVAKATYVVPGPGSNAGTSSLAVEQDPLRGDEPSRHADRVTGFGLRDADYASDFVPRRSRVDVTVVGKAHAAEPSSRIACSLKVGDASKEFFAVASRPEMEIPLVRESVRDARLGPSSVGALPPSDLRSSFAGGPRNEGEARLSRRWLDLPPDELGASFQGAPADQMAWDLRFPLRVELDNLSRGGGRRTLLLPALAPSALLWRPGKALVDAELVAMRCEAVHLDTDRDRLSLTFRGEAVLDTRGGEPEVVICLLPIGEAPRAATLEATLGAARVFLAATGVPPDADEIGESPSKDDGTRTLLASGNPSTTGTPFRARASTEVVPTIHAKSPVVPEPGRARRDSEVTALLQSASETRDGLPFERDDLGRPRVVRDPARTQAMSASRSTTTTEPPPAPSLHRPDAPLTEPPPPPREPEALEPPSPLRVVDGEVPARSVILRGGWRLVSEVAAEPDRITYRIEHESKPVNGVVELLHPALRGEVKAVTRFAREAVLRDRIHHPGVQPLLDRGTFEGAPFIVNGEVGGLTLAEIVARRAEKKIPIEQALFLFEAGLDVLASLEEAGVVHSAIRPSVLSIVGSELVVSGLRSVREAFDPNEPAEIAASDPGFMSPEVALGRWDEVGPAADQWALAAVVYWALSGRWVHTAHNRQRGLLAAMTRPAPPLAGVAPWVPESIAAIVDRALSPSPSERYPSCGELLEALAALDGDPSEADHQEEFVDEETHDVDPEELEEAASHRPPDPPIDEATSRVTETRSPIDEASTAEHDETSS